MMQSETNFTSKSEQASGVRMSAERQRELDRSLPPANTQRWVMRRKAQVVSAVRAGLLTFEEACERYRLSEEEFKTWMNLLDAHGVRGLRATRMQDYRHGDMHEAAE